MNWNLSLPCINLQSLTIHTDDRIVCTMKMRNCSEVCYVVQRRGRTGDCQGDPEAYIGSSSGLVKYQMDKKITSDSQGEMH